MRALYTSMQPTAFERVLLFGSGGEAGVDVRLESYRGVLSASEGDVEELMRAMAMNALNLTPHVVRRGTLGARA